MDKLNVLVLEDESLIYQQLTKILQKMGLVNIFTVSTSTEALALASQYSFHLMLTTVKIGESYDGLNTVKALQKQHTLTVIFICSQTDEVLLKKVSEVNFIGYLIKPFREHELETLIIIAIENIKHPKFPPPSTPSLRQ